MNRPENIPLLSKSYSTEDSKNGYLLLTVPQTKDNIVLQKLNKLGNYSGTIVAVSASFVVFVLIFVISFQADVSELTDGNSKFMSVKKASDPNSFPDTELDTTISSSTEIETPLGRVKGYLRQSRKGRAFHAFYNVPYAKPPLGDLRFKDPQPADSWEGLRDFDKVAPSCLQQAKNAKNSTIGQEDCLYSNIYIPHLTEKISQQNLPVMVDIHGGGFLKGNGSKYGAEYFMDEDVILVTFQYRLGLLGFLSSGDREITGNMGFKDQVMFLRWTKENIESFGGDPNRVTIFGNSMGGTSVSVLMISPMANGLFHGAISQSGTILCESPTLFDFQPEVTKKAVAEAFNCSLEDSTQLAECLRQIDANDLVLLKSRDIKFALTVEQGFNPSDLSNVIMPEKPYDLLKAGKVNKVPYIMGVVSTEMVSSSLALLGIPGLINEINANFSTYAPILLGLDLTPEESQMIKSFYFNDKLISNETERNLTNLVSDRMMVHGTKVTADFFSLVSDSYLYVLSKPAVKSYAGDFMLNFPNLDTSTVVSHADEVQFQFPYSGYPEYPITDTDNFPFSEFFIKLWANFAATGKPVIEGKVTDWNPITNSKSSTSEKSSFWYELNDESGVTMALEERMQFWDQFSHKKLLLE